jgi:hypothetical protein
MGAHSEGGSNLGGSQYSEDVWPDFVKLDPEDILQIQEFLS